MNRKIIGAICLNEQYHTRELTFEEILLDERLAQGEVWILKAALQSVGGINYRLPEKQNYELLIRIAKEYTVLQLPPDALWDFLSNKTNIFDDSWMCLQADTFANEASYITDDHLKTDCYLIGRYKSELISMGYFNDSVLGILSVCSEDVAQYLEKMVSGTKEYYDLYDCTQPILIYTGSDLCYNILDTFSKELGLALTELGQCVEYFDMSVLSENEPINYTQRRFKAVIGMQTYMFSIKWKTGQFIHNEISGPKYNFIFDHPIWHINHLKQTPHKLRILTPDGNYAAFINNYYNQPATFLPPAGSNLSFKKQQRDYDISFLGSYGKGLVKNLWLIRKNDKKRAHMLNRYILYMRKDFTLTPENAFRKMLEYYGILYNNEIFLEMFYPERWVILGLADHYRNKVINTLLKSGITLHVFGDTWKNSPMYGHSALIWHDAVFGDEALNTYARSKLSLNIMRWHKDGFTERIANAMLQKSVVITDRTSYLETHFEHDHDLILFDLQHLEELPSRIITLLNDDKKRTQLAENGYQKAIQQHTWHNRARKVLELIEEDSHL